MNTARIRTVTRVLTTATVGAVALVVLGTGLILTSGGDRYGLAGASASVDSPPATSLTRAQVSLRWYDSAGRDRHCRVALETAHLDHEEQRAVEKVVSSDRWTGFGETTLATLGLDTAVAWLQEQRLHEELHAELVYAVARVVPDLASGNTHDAPTVVGQVSTCD